MSKLIILSLVCLFITSCHCFTTNGLKSLRNNRLVSINNGNRQLSSSLFGGDKFEIIPMEDKNVQNASAVTTGFVGFVLVGPVGAIILAAIANYASKKDTDFGVALRGVGKTVIDSANYLRKLNSKYDITSKAVDNVTKAVSSIETDSSVLKIVKETVDNVVGTVTKLDEQYALVSKGSIVIDTAANLSDKALEKVEELNSKYDFIATSKKLVGTAVEKIREQASNP